MSAYLIFCMLFLTVAGGEDAAVLLRLADGAAHGVYPVKLPCDTAGISPDPSGCCPFAGRLVSVRHEAGQQTALHTMRGRWAL